MRLRRYAFTMLELVFVIVILGIIGKFGVEFLAEAYKSFIHSKVNNELQANSEYAVEFISSRLQHRIKDSVIARTSAAGTPIAIGSASGSTYVVLEWVGADVDGFRGSSDNNSTPNLPNWSGIADIEAGTNAVIVSPGTDTTKVNDMISILSNTNSTVNDAALYFVGSSSDAKTGYGWDGNTTTINAQIGAMHPINSNANANQFVPDPASTAPFQEVYEYYKLAWSAYAIVMEDYNATTEMGNLVFYYDYQPWKGENFTNNAKSATILNDVSTFQFMSVGSIIKIQVCAKSDLLKDQNGSYSLCKEKTVF